MKQHVAPYSAYACYGRRFNLHLPKIRRASIWPIALMVAAFISAMAGGIVPVQALPTFTLTINTASPGHEVSKTLNGYSDETGSIMSNGTAVYPNGWRYAATNTEVIQLFMNAGIQSMRIGGNGVENKFPADYDITNYFGWCEALGIPTIYSLSYSNWLDTNRSYDMNTATFIYNNYGQYIDQNGGFGSGGGDLLWFALGNEPNGYFGCDSEAQFKSWINSWNPMCTTIQTISPTNLFWFGECDVTVKDKNHWLTNYITSEHQDDNWSARPCLVAATKHFSPLGAEGDLTEYGLAVATLTNMENGNNYFQTEVNTLHPLLAGYTDWNMKYYAFTEFNNCAQTTGNTNTDDTFAYGLFALDALNWFAANAWYNNYGCVSMNFLATVNGFKAYCYTVGTGSSLQLEAYPLMYGQAAYALTVEPDVTDNPANCLYVPVSATRSPSYLNVEAYAMAHYDTGSSGHCTNLYVTVINKTMDFWKTNVSVTIKPQSVTGNNVDVIYLTQADGSSTAGDGTTLGGADLNGFSQFQPVWKHLGTLSGGQYTSTVTNLSAAIFRIGSIY